MQGGVGWVIQRWGRSCRGGMDHVGVGWVMQGWGGVGHTRVGWGGNYRVLNLEMAQDLKSDNNNGTAGY